MRLPDFLMKSQRSGVLPGFKKALVGSDELVVILHAYDHGPYNIRHVRDRVTAIRPRADVYVPRMPTGVFSFADPNSIVAELLKDIDHIVSQKGKPGYSQITLIGHSLGALLARKLYIAAHGENADAPFETALANSSPRAWVQQVDRIILLAAMNRGWSISHHLSIYRAISWSLGVWILTLLSLVRRGTPLISTIRRGASFITQLRVQWLSMLRRASQNQQALATTIQLLGTIDDMVSPDDNIDLATGGQFIYLDVPVSGHANVIDMDDSPFGLQRLAVFQRALSEPAAILKAGNLQPVDLLFTPDDRVKNVIFVIHGIRDEGFWTHKIARKVMTLWKAAGPPNIPTFASVTSSYGYYAMLPFLLLGRRLEKVRWLMDQYTEAMARYPQADFDFVGHSNGTYLLARALQDNPSCHFRRIVFAGSVVRTDFDWARLQTSRLLSDGTMTKPQVGAVLNYVATADWVVAFFPKAFELLHLQDLGSAGHDGFSQLSGQVVGSQAQYIRGPHGAALNEANWDDIAQFVVQGIAPPTTDSRFCGSRSLFIKLLGKIAPLVWVCLIAAAAALWYFVNGRIGNPYWQGACLITYLLLLYKVLTSF